MTKIRQFFFTLHKSSQDEKLRAVEFCRTFKPIWFMVALEPYMDKDGHHLHIMFQLKNPRSPRAVKADFMKKFKKNSQDCFQQPGKGRFNDNKNYITNANAGEHKDDPKVLDSEPVIWPDDFVEAVKADFMKKFKKNSQDCFQQPGKGRFNDNKNYITNANAGEHKDDPKVLDSEPVIWPDDFVEAAPRRSDSDMLIEDIRNGATYNQLLNAYPKYVLNNSAKIEKFMKGAKASGFIRPDLFLNYKGLN